MVIKAMNCQLVPAAVPALYALYALRGHESPKQTNIDASRICVNVNYLPPMLFVTTQDSRLDSNVIPISITAISITPKPFARRWL